MFLMVGMTIKPLDILYLLDVEDVDQMDYVELNNLCIAITLDEQLTQESIARNESSSNRGNMC
jgi:hypothetical protein